MQLDKDDEDLQWILWRESLNQPLKSYRFSRSTFGLSPSAFLDTRCLMQLGYEYRAEFPEASQSICNDFHVDDFISEGSTIVATIKSKMEVEYMLLSA